MPGNDRALSAHGQRRWRSGTFAERLAALPSPNPIKTVAEWGVGLLPPPAHEMPEAKRYRNLAFLSYSHRDMALARRLHADLETYRLPRRQSCDRDVLADGKRVRPVFRDQTDLDIRDDSFWNQIDEQLKESRFLLVLCSPSAAASANVDKEVAAFLGSRDDALESILPILHGGNIAAVDGPRQCLPPSLQPFRHRIAERPLPNAETDSRLELLLKTVSWLLRVRFATLHENHRHRQLLQRTRAAALLTMIVAALGVAAWLVQRANASASGALVARKAETERADREAMAAASDDYFGHIRLAAQALEHHDVVGAKRALDACAGSLRNWEWGFLWGQVDQSVTRFDCEPKAMVPVAGRPDGTQLAVCGADQRVHVYRVTDGREACATPATDALLNVVAWSPDGQTIAGGTASGVIHIWNAATGGAVASHSAASSINQLRFAKSGSSLFALLYGGAVVQLDPASAEPVGKAMPTVNFAGRFELAEDGELLCAMDVDGRRLRGFATATQQMLWERTPERRARFSDFTFTPDGRLLVIGTDGDGAFLADSTTGRTVAQIGSGNGRVRRTTFAGPGSSIWLGGAEGTVAAFQFLPTVDQTRDIATFSAHTTRINAMEPFAYGMVLTASDDLSIAAWRAFDCGQIGRFRGHEHRVLGTLPFREAAADLDGRGSFASWSDDGTVRVWSLARQVIPVGTEVRDQMADESAGSPPTAVDASPDGRLGIVRSSLGGGTVALIELATRKSIASLRHSAWVGAVAFANDANSVITGTRDGVAVVWSTSNGEKLGALDGHGGPITAVSLSSDGALAACCAGGELRIWHPRSDEPWRAWSLAGGDVQCMCFSSEGTRLAVGYESGAVEVRNLPDGPSLSLRGHEKAVRRVEFDRSSKRLLSSSFDGTARVWDISGGLAVTVMDAGEALVGASLSADGCRALALSVNARLSVFEVATQKVILQFPLRMGPAHSVQFLTLESQVLVTSGSGEMLWLQARY